MVCCISSVDRYRQKRIVLYGENFGKLKYLYFYATVCKLPSKLNWVNGVYELRINCVLIKFKYDLLKQKNESFKQFSLANWKATTFYT